MAIANRPITVFDTDPVRVAAEKMQQNLLELATAEAPATP
jgi:hypothetical protein